MSAFLTMRLRHVLVLGLASVWQACGPQEPKVDQQERGKINKPAFEPLNEGVRLDAQGDAKLRFEGPLVFWRAEVQPELLRRSLAVSREIKDLEVAAKAAKLTYLKTEETLAKEQAERNQIVDQQLGGKFDEELDKFYRMHEAATQANTAEWYNSRLDPEQQGAFETYCQARLWQFARGDLVRQYEFTSRPTPLAICEPYYERQGYFADPACAPAGEAEAAGKSYFACFWGPAGVGHTDIQFFEQRQELDASARAEVLKLFAGNDWPTALDSQQSDKFLRLDGRLLAVRFGGELVTSVLAQPLGDFLAKDQELVAWEDFLFEHDTERGGTLSLHDRIFNLHRLGANAEKRRKLDFPHSLNGALNAFSARPAGLAISIDAIAARAAEAERAEQARLAGLRAELDKRVAIAQSAKEKANDEWGARDRAVIAKKRAAGWDILEQNQAQALYGKSTVELTIQGERVEVVLQMDPVSTAQKARGCANWQSKQAMPCPTLDPADVPLQVSLDRQSGLLTLSLDLRDEGLVTALGLKAQALPAGGRNEEPRFQQWQESELVGKQLKMELYPRSYQDMAILTGKAFLFANAEEWAQGTASLAEKL